MTPDATTNSPLPLSNQSVVVVSNNAPIRFPHIPARDGFPKRSIATFQNSGATHRVDADHPRMASAVAAIPGIRTPNLAQAESANAEALDNQVLPEPTRPATGADDTRRSPSELLALSEQMRRRLMDFGNLLSARNQDPRLERAFETVCQSFSQLHAVVEGISRQ